jgi:hypothetical protein
MPGPYTFWGREKWRPTQAGFDKDKVNGLVTPLSIPALLSVDVLM